MHDNNKIKIAVVGAGLVGAGWAIVFARSGCNVRVFDENVQIRNNFLKEIEKRLIELKSFNLIESWQETIGKISVYDDISETVDGVHYVQESVFEDISSKEDIFKVLDTICKEEVVIGSSSSGIPGSKFTENLVYGHRCLVAHPVNPPYLIPLVEIVPTPWTTSLAVDYTWNLMKLVGQEPIRIGKEIEGFILNRLQGALLNEAWALYDEGYASLEDIDKTVSQGLGLRWSFMGPFKTIHLNAPGGVSDYASRLSSLYFSIAKSRTNPKPWNKELVDKVEVDLSKELPITSLKDGQNDRDKSLMKLISFMSKHKAKK